MKWYYKLIGQHVHVRVFMNGGKCGDLVFREEEFALLKTRALRSSPYSIVESFIGEDELSEAEPN